MTRCDNHAEMILGILFLQNSVHPSYDNPSLFSALAFAASDCGEVSICVVHSGCTSRRGSHTLAMGYG